LALADTADKQKRYLINYIDFQGEVDE